MVASKELPEAGEAPPAAALDEADGARDEEADVFGLGLAADAVLTEPAAPDAVVVDPLEEAVEVPEAGLAAGELGRTAALATAPPLEELRRDERLDPRLTT